MLFFECFLSISTINRNSHAKFERQIRAEPNIDSIKINFGAVILIKFNVTM